MIGSIGTMELIVILVIALMVFGPRKLPELGRSIGKSLGEFKRASNDLRHTLEDEIHVEEQARREAARPAPAPGRMRRPGSRCPIPWDRSSTPKRRLHAKRPSPHPPRRRPTPRRTRTRSSPARSDRKP